MPHDQYFVPLARCCKCKQPACYELVTISEVRRWGASPHLKTNRKPYCQKCADAHKCKVVIEEEHE